METSELQQPTRSVSPVSRWRLEGTHYDLCLAAILSALVVGDVALARWVRLIGPGHLLDWWPWLRFGLMYLVLLYCCRRPLPRLVDAARMAMWSGIFLSPLSVLVQLAGRTRYGLVDRQLAGIDQCLHFDTAAISNSIRHVPLLFACSLVAYSLFGPLVLSALMVPSVCGHGAVSRRFFVALLFTLLLTAAIFLFVPAAGPWTTEAVRPMASQTAVTDYLLRLKSALPVAMDMDHAGVVSFPSVHAAFAVLSASALGAVRPIRTFAWVLCGVVCISTVTTGWHYGIDVIGGVLVALLAQAVANRVCTMLDRQGKQTPAAATLEVCSR